MKKKNIDSRAKSHSSNMNSADDSTVRPDPSKVFGDCSHRDQFLLLESDGSYAVINEGGDRI